MDTTSFQQATRRAASRRAVAALAVVVLGGFLVGAGAQRSFAFFTSSGTVGGNAFTTAASFDTVAPTVSATVVSKSGPWFDGFVKQAGAYYVYADATDGGVAPSGIASITANVATVTTGQTAVALVGGSYSVEGVSYGFRSALLTATTPLAAGSKAYTLTSVDNNGNSRLQTGFTVTVDNTAPTAVDIQAVNGGATLHRPDPGDTIAWTFSEVIDPQSILAGWTGASTNVVVRFTNSGANDTIAVWNAANTTQLAMGTVNSQGNFVTGAVTSGASGTPSTMVLDTATNRITITLGTMAGTTRTDNNNNISVWSPSASAFDRAGNAMSTTTVNETGTNDADF